MGRWQLTIMVLLRYFNPVGAHSSGQIERTKGAAGQSFSITHAGIRSHLDIYGDDYDTLDGTVRDYIHITDLVEGHIAALHFAEHNSGVEIFNLGTGRAIQLLRWWLLLKLRQAKAFGTR